MQVNDEVCVCAMLGGGTAWLGGKWNLKIRREHANRVPLKPRGETPFKFNMNDDDCEEVAEDSTKRDDVVVEKKERVKKAKAEKPAESTAAAAAVAAAAAAAANGSASSGAAEKKKKKKKAKIDYSSDEEAAQARAEARMMGMDVDDEEEEGSSDDDDSEDARRQGDRSSFVSEVARDSSAKNRAKDEDSSADDYYGEKEREDPAFALKQGIAEGNVVVDKKIRGSDKLRTKKNAKLRNKAIDDEMDSAEEVAKDYEEDSEALNGYEDDDDSDEDDDDDKKSKKKPKEAAAAVKVDTSAKTTVGVNSSLMGSLLKGKALKKLTPEEVARASNRTSFLSTASLDTEMPRLLYECILPPDVVKKMREWLKAELSKADVVDLLSPDEMKQCEKLCLVNMSQFLWIVASLTDAKDCMALEDSQKIAYDTFKGDYSEAAVAKHKDVRMFWAAEQVKGARRLSYVKSDKTPIGARAVDYAYTKNSIEQIQDLLPESFLRIVSASIPLHYFLEHIFVDAKSDFVATKAQVDAISKQNGGKPWLCSFSGLAIEPGDVVRCICGAPDQTKDPADRLRSFVRGIEAGAFVEMGIGKSIRKFAMSDVNSPQLKNAPFVFFVRVATASEKEEAAPKTAEEPAAPTDEDVKMEPVAAAPVVSEPVAASSVYDDDDDSDDDEVAVVPAPTAEAAPVAEEKPAQVVGEKRKADGEVAAKNGTTKRYRTSKLPYEIVTHRDETAFDPIRASVTEPEMIRTIKSEKGREFTASCVGAGTEAISPLTKVFLTDAAVEVLHKARNWLLVNMQMNVPMPDSDPKKVAIATGILRVLFDADSVPGYGSKDVDNTAALLASKLSSLETATTFYMSGGGMQTTKLKDNSILDQWFRFILCSFVHCNEAKLMMKKDDITGRDNAVLANDDAAHMAVDEVPFGRFLTSQPFTLQMIRIILNVFVRSYVFPLGELISKTYEENGGNPVDDSIEKTAELLDEASPEWRKLYTLHDFVEELIRGSYDESTKLNNLQAALDEFPAGDDAARSECINTYLTKKICDASINWPTTEKVSTGRRDSLSLVKAWRMMRAKLRADRIFSEEKGKSVADLPQTFMFASKIFPLQI